MARDAPEGMLEEAVGERPPFLEEQGQAHERKGNLDGILFLLEEQRDGNGEAHRCQNEKFHRGSPSGSTKKDHRRPPVHRPGSGMAPLQLPGSRMIPGACFSGIIPAMAGQVKTRDVVYSLE